MEPLESTGISLRRDHGMQSSEVISKFIPKLVFNDYTHDFRILSTLVSLVVNSCDDR